ncbi:2Fe-2S ferredoxin [Alphaproteobacteria bacterium]
MSVNKSIKIHFVNKDGTTITVSAPIGLSVLEVAHQNNIDLDGACGGALACAACHVVVDEEFIDKLPPPSAEEEDVLDLVFGLTKASRLGCQIIITEELEGLIITVPGTKSIT